MSITCHRSELRKMPTRIKFDGQKQRLAPRTSAFLGRWSALKRIQIVDFSYCGIDQAELEHFAEGFCAVEPPQVPGLTFKKVRQLQEINLSHNTDIVSLRHLARVMDNAPKLEKITIYKCSVKGQSCEELAKAICAQKVDQKGRVLDRWAHGSLKYLKLGAMPFGNPIGARGACYLADALAIAPHPKFPQTACLEELYLDSCEVHDEGAERFGEALKMNKTLKVLSLKANEISDTGMVQLSACFRNNVSLKLVALDHNAATNRGAIVVANNMSVNKNSALIVTLKDQRPKDFASGNVTHTITNEVKVKCLELSRNRLDI